MPKRAAVGTHLRFRVTPAIEPLENRTLLSNTWFVATNGNDAGPGTLQQPFKTIQTAANVAQSGDTVDIEGGTYRETVHPAHSGVTFTSYKGQTVTLTGTDQITGWSSKGTASMPWDLGEGNNQVFVDGQMVNEARWPNSSPDPLHPTEATVGGYSNGFLYDQSITQGSGFWAGATITVTPGDSWVAYTGVVNNSGPGWLQISLPSSGISQVETPVAGNSYFLSGKLQALDAPGEWYRDASGTLYLWDPANDNPAGHDVEVKHRQYGFDLSGVANTTIKGVNLFACTIHTDWASSGTIINGITAAYVTQFNNLWGSGWAPPGPYGIELSGGNSILENSTIAFSAGDGVYVNAPNVRVTGNVIHDVDYSGTDAAGIRVMGANAMIDHNTIYNAGRDGINLEAAPAQVLNNVVHDFMLLTYDGAAIYTQRLNGQGSTIAYNTVFNAHKNNYIGLDACGIMLDNDASSFSIHDNTTANVDAGLKANNTSFNEQIYNNLFGATQYGIESNAWTGFAYNWWGTQLYNNVFYNSNLKLGTNLAQWNNAFTSGSPALNVPMTAGSPIPTPEPMTAPANATGGNVGASSGSATGSTPLSPAAAQPPVTGTVEGRFLASRKTAKRAATYRLSAIASLTGLGKVHVTGAAIGAIVKGSATGTLRLANAKGAVRLSLNVPAASNAMPTPSDFAYTVTRATGAYKKLAGSGILNLTFTPTNKRGTAGTFKLVLAGGIAALS